MKVIDILRKNDSNINEILKYILDIDIFKNFDYTLNNKEKNKFLYLKKKYDNSIPIEYIVKKAYFDKYTFFVNKNVLIPRIETSDILAYLSSEKYKNILDLATGSGAVGISIKKINPKIKVTLSDISLKALHVADINRNDLDIDIIHSDLIANIENILSFDCIFANLPYIKDMDSLPSSVKDYEPKIALFGGINGVEIILRLINELEKIKWRGDLYLELDPAEIKYIKKEKEIIKDRFNKNRFIKIKFN
jgi:release factor glutamine methyltransferase